VSIKFRKFENEINLVTNNTCDTNYENSIKFPKELFLTVSYNNQNTISGKDLIPIWDIIPP
jgi:hypothetical protein